MQHIIENLKKNEEVLNDFDKVDQKTWKPTDHQVYQAYSQHISDDLAAYKKQADILRQAGVDVPDYEPTHASAASKANDEAKQRHAATLTARESYGRLFIRNAARREDERIDALRHHFLSRSRTQPVEIQQDLANIDQYIKQSIETSKWEPVPATIAKTAVGQAFLNKVNESISYVKERALLAGVPVAEALAHQELTAKSLSSILASEKTLVRRDISLALKKAFYNSVDSGDLKKATNLMASYFDDFIDTIMGTYTNIPIDLRKLFTRKMLKSLIDEVIKDNKYSAVSMRDDFTAPLDTDVIKSMGGEIAAVVTKFKMQANPDSDFLVIDLSKSISGGNPREVEAVQERSRLLKGQTGTPIEWFHWLKGLENDMYKSGCVTTHISDNRIRKFIADNDQSVLLDFYNSSVNDLNNRCKEIKEWQE